MARTVLYGGTFNPVHMGHTKLCRYLLGTGEYDRIVVMPTASPPHKEAAQLASAEHRMAMLRLAFREIPGVELDDWEIRQGGKSYTVDTVAYLSQRYPQDELFLLMGSDMFRTFTEWKDWCKVGKETVLLVAARHSDDRAALLAKQKELEAEGVCSRVVENPVLEVSSTEIRRELAHNGSASQLDSLVETYCKDNLLYREKYDLEQLKGIIKPLLKPDRYHHSLCVAEMADQLAWRYGADENKAAAAGLLHDICKNMPNESLLQIIANCDTIIPIDFETQPQLLHSFAGAEYIRTVLGIEDNELVDAVRYHTSARGGMSLMEQIVYLADLGSADRSYPDVEHFRELAQTSTQQAMDYALEYITRDLARRGLTPCEYTIEAFKQYTTRKERD